jgi:RNA polymerase sigma-70 factor, ECF subfamily
MSNTEHWVERALGGERSALEEVFRRHRSRLVAWIALAAPPALTRRVPAEDLAQETLLEAARKLDRFEPRGPRSFYAWLVGIARHKLSEAQRAELADKRGGGEALLRDPTGRITSPTRAAARAERAERVRAALLDLPEAQAEALRLRYLEGLSTAEVAARMERSETAVKALVVRAFGELAGRLDSDSSECAPPRTPAAPLGVPDPQSLGPPP